MVKFVALCAAIACTIMFLSCSSETTSSEPPVPFSLKITVKDTTGHPVPNLRIAGGSLLSLTDMAHQGVRPWVVQIGRVRLVASDTTGSSVLFRDSILAVYATPDNAAPGSLLGYTTAAGVLQLDNAARFPGVFALPSIPETDEFDSVISQFTIRDTALFRIVDTATHAFQTVYRVLGNGANTFEFVWRPTLPGESMPGRTEPSISGATDGARRSEGVFRVLSSTAMHFDAPVPAKIDLSVFRVDGYSITTLVNQRMPAGRFSIIWSTFVEPIAKGADSVVAVGPTPVIPTVWKLDQNYPNPFN